MHKSKNLMCSILLMPPSKTYPQVFIIIPQADESYPFFPNSIFSLAKTGESIMELKKLPNITRVLVTGFAKLHHLCNLYIFGLYFVVQQLRFKHAKV